MVYTSGQWCSCPRERGLPEPGKYQVQSSTRMSLLFNLRQLDFLSYWSLLQKQTLLAADSIDIAIKLYLSESQAGSASAGRSQKVE